MSIACWRIARLVLAALWIGVPAAPVPARAQSKSPPPVFGALIERLSEPGGDFGGDNLISNEQSYLHVLPALAQAGVAGGAYIGVGPDQNFSYIAQIKPAIAYIVDIRRDNLLLHLLFKAMFAEAATRVEYLCLLTGRPPPARAETWRDAGIDSIIAHVDGAQPLPDPAQRQTEARLERTIAGFAVALSAADLATIRSCREQFATAGLALVFQARGRPPNRAYPSLRTLLRETDRAGRQLSFLASEPAYQFVRSLQSRHLIVPVVGDFSGPQALRAIGADMTARGAPLSALYISNVEYYLFRTPGGFARYTANLRQLPRSDRSMIIRSVFPSGGSRNLPQSMPGIYSVSLAQPLRAMLDDLAAGKYRNYADLTAASSR